LQTSQNQIPSVVQYNTPTFQYLALNFMKPSCLKPCSSTESMSKSLSEQSRHSCPCWRSAFSTTISVLIILTTCTLGHLLLGHLCWVN